MSGTSTVPWRGIFLAGLGAGLLSPASGAGQEKSGSGSWHVFGSSQTSVDYYAVDGDQAASPYQFEGTFWSSRLDLSLAFETDRGRSFLLGVELLGAEDDYLAEDGAVLESLSLSFEDGGAGLPFRLGMGDFYADLSQRTLQGEVRGLSVEIQPRLGGGDHSLLVLSGTGEPSWDETFDGAGEDLYYNGVSYLFSSPLGRAALVANYVDVAQDPEGTAASFGFGEDHEVASLFGEARAGNLVLEAEVALLRPEQTGEDVEETSFYAQLARGNKAFTWRLRYEDNDEAFDPTGAVGVIADRRIAEIHARYGKGPGGAFSGRMQHIENAVDGPGPQTDTEVLALAYDGRPLEKHRGFRLHLSGEANDITADDGSLDQLFQSYRLELENRSKKGWSVSYGAKYRATDSDVPATVDRSLVDQSLSLGRTFGTEVRWSVKCGAIYREQRESAGYETWSPLLDVSAQSEHHRLSLHLSFLDQDFAAPTTDDLQYQTQRLSYSLTAGSHTLTLLVDRELREPEEGEESDSLRVGLQYLLRFDRAW